MPLLLSKIDVQVCKKGMNAGRRMLIHIIHMDVFLIMPAPFTGIGAIINILSYYVNRYFEKYLPIDTVGNRKYNMEAIY